MKKLILLSFLIQFLFCLGSDNTQQPSLTKIEYNRPLFPDEVGYDLQSKESPFTIKRAYSFNSSFKAPICRSMESRRSVYVVETSEIDFWSEGRMIFGLIVNSSSRYYRAVFIPELAKMLDEQQKENYIAQVIENEMFCNLLIHYKFFETILEACNCMLTEYENFRPGSVRLAQQIIPIDVAIQKGCCVIQ